VPRDFGKKEKYMANLIEKREVPDYNNGGTKTIGIFDGEVDQKDWKRHHVEGAEWAVGSTYDTNTPQPSEGFIDTDMVESIKFTLKFMGILFAIGLFFTIVFAIGSVYIQ
jgi:hypothetical protein